MSTFVIVDKKSHTEKNVEASNIDLKSPSVVHTKLYRDDVAEFVQDGNNLILKLKNGKTVVIAKFFVKDNEEESELLFEDEDCGLPWWPLLLGGVAGAGAIAAAAGGGGGKDGDATTTPVAPVIRAPSVDVTGYEDNVGAYGNIGDKVTNILSGGLTKDNLPDYFWYSKKCQRSCCDY